MMKTQRTIWLGTQDYPYELTKSRRKSMAIQIRPDGSILVKAPSWVLLREIEKYLRQKEDWIVTTLHRVATAQSIRAEHRWETGERLLWLGKEYLLAVNTDTVPRKDRVRLLPERIVLSVDAETGIAVKQGILEHWYREQARTFLTAKAEHFAGILGLTYADIRIKAQKSRWGSCSTKGNLNFNWHIIMAPETVVDYLVIHELCHLRYMNHSPEYWDFVAELYPDYKKARKWLRENGNALKNW